MSSSSTCPFLPKYPPFPSLHTKKLNHNTQINIITIVCALANSWISDSLPGAARWPGMLFASIMAIIFPIALAATPVHPKWKAQRWVLYCEFFHIHPANRKELENRVVLTYNRSYLPRWNSSWYHMDIRQWIEQTRSWKTSLCLGYG